MPTNNRVRNALYFAISTTAKQCNNILPKASRVRVIDSHYRENGTKSAPVPAGPLQRSRPGAFYNYANVICASGFQNRYPLSCVHFNAEIPELRLSKLIIQACNVTMLFCIKLKLYMPV